MLFRRPFPHGCHYLEGRSLNLTCQGLAGRRGGGCRLLGLLPRPLLLLFLVLTLPWPLLSLLPRPLLLLDWLTWLLNLVCLFRLFLSLGSVIRVPGLSVREVLVCRGVHLGYHELPGPHDTVAGLVRDVVVKPQQPRGVHPAVGPEHRAVV